MPCRVDIITEQTCLCACINKVFSVISIKMTAWSR